jgi:hypothetical protein
MTLPKDVRKEIERIISDYCVNRIPEHARHQVKMIYNIRGNSITIFEERPHWQDPTHKIKSPIAQFRYNTNTEKWSLYYADRNLRWHNYEFKSTRDIRILLQEVDEDPTHIFWG